MSNSGLLRDSFYYLDKEFKEGEVYLLHLPFSDVEKYLKDNSLHIVKATLLSTCLGMYDIDLNHQKIDDQFFKPGFQTYSKRLCYQENDITSLLKESGNVFDIYVGQGWYCGRFYCENTVQNFGSYPMISVVLILSLDNQEEKIITLENEDAYSSYYDYAGEYDGEVIDFNRKEQVLGKLKKTSIDPNMVLEPTLTKVVSHEKISSVSATKTEDGKYILDFGQNLAGVVSVNLSKLKKDQNIVIRHGEILNEDGSLYTANLRNAKAMLSIISDGREGIYTPRFTYMGFRYVEVSGCDDVRDLLSVSPIHTRMKRTGYFQCGNQAVNQLYSNQLWGQRSNYVEIPTDCPQRDERLGYTGDGHVFALTGSYNYQTLDFWKNFFRDLRLSQDMNSDGNVAPYLPQCKPHEVGFMTMQGWGSCVSIVPEIMLNQYGDEAFFRENYQAIKRYVDLEITKSKGKGLWKGISLGDWLSMDKGIAWAAMHNHPVSNAFFVHDLKVMTEEARMAGNQEDYKYYSEQYQKTRKAYIKAFVSSRTGKVKNDYQGNYVLALRHVLDPIEDKDLYQKVAKRFIENVRKNGLQTGFFGTEHLLPLLCDLNETELAYDTLLSHKCPGWMYQIDHGATTMWERWNAIKEDGHVNEEKVTSSNMVSFNHYSFGSVGEFYYQYILGIKPLVPGYQKIRIQPFVDERLGSVSGKYESVNGTIEVSYQFYPDRIEFTINTPCSTLIILPDSQRYEVEKGVYNYLVRR